MEEIGNSMINLESNEVLTGMSKKQIKEAHEGCAQDEVICFKEDVGIPNCQFVHWGVAKKDESLPKGWNKVK